jgi:hypothetical protein
LFEQNEELKKQLEEEKLKIDYISHFLKKEKIYERLRALIGSFSDRGDTASKLSLKLSPIDQPRISKDNEMFIGLLPEIAKNIDIEEEGADELIFAFLKGMTFHELSHYDYTKFKPFIDFIKKENGKHEGLRKHVFNVLEDGRIERIKADRDKSTGKYFDLINLAIADFGKNDPQSQQPSEFQDFMSAVWMLSKLNMYPEKYDEFSDKTKEKIEEAIPFINDAVFAKSTKRCSVPSEVIVKIAKELMTEEEKEESESQEAGELEVSSEESGEGSGEGENENDGEGNPSSSGNPSNKQGQSRGKPNKFQDNSEGLKKILKRNAKEEMKEKNNSKGKNGKDEKSLSDQEITEIEKQYSGEKFVENKHKLKFSNQLPLELKRRGRIFRKEMEKILKRKKKEVLIGQRKGILNPTELHKLASMEVEVFKKIISPQSMENAVYVLRDGSGSMWSAEKSKSSVEAASVIEEGIKGLIPYKDVIFHTFGPNITHEVICDFSDKNTKENKAWNYQNFFNGTNKDGFSIRIAVAELMRRTEQGKILFVLSDGLPSDYRSENEAKNDVKSIVREAKKNGISVISIFFGSEHERNALREKYREMYGNSVICVDPSKIEKNIINILKKMVKNT